MSNDPRIAAPLPAVGDVVTWTEMGDRLVVVAAYDDFVLAEHEDPERRQLMGRWPLFPRDFRPNFVIERKAPQPIDDPHPTAAPAGPAFDRDELIAVGVITDGTAS